MMAQETECDSIAAAAKLSEAEYQEAHREVAQCADNLYTEAKQMFTTLGDEAVSRRKKKASQKLLIRQVGYREVVDLMTC